MRNKKCLTRSSKPWRSAIPSCRKDAVNDIHKNQTNNQSPGHCVRVLDSSGKKFQLCKIYQFASPHKTQIKYFTCSGQNMGEKIKVRATCTACRLKSN